MWSRVDVKITRLPSGKKYEQASCPRSLTRHLVLPSSEKIQVSAPVRALRRVGAIRVLRLRDDMIVVGRVIGFGR